jgi:peptidoglycan-associated lipoprotein
MYRSSGYFGSLALGTSTVVLLAACSKDPPPPRAPTQAKAEVQELRAEPRDDETAVVVSEEIRTRCGLPRGAENVPRFDYDEASLRPRGRTILDDVADCLSRGALQGQAVTLIGRADPRGSAEYNAALGQSRADAARRYLLSQGVAPQHVTTLSHGEQGALGNDEESWALDRRVDLVLGEGEGTTGMLPQP